MISNQVLQTTIDGLKSITRIDICVMDIEGKALATTINNVEEYEEAVMAFVDSPADSQVLQGYQFFKVFDDHQLEYVILAKGDTDDVYMVGKLAAFQIRNLLVAYKERYDKDNFIKNLLLDNLLLVDIYNRAKKLHIETNVKRVVFLIETKNEKDVNALETIKGLFAGKKKDFITQVDEKNIILVKEVAENIANKRKEKSRRAKQIKELNEHPNVKLMKEMEAVVYLNYVEQLSPNLVNELHEAGYLVDGSVINTKERLAIAQKLGVDLIESDHPELILKLLEAENEG